MKVPKLARVAGESFSLITGANIAYDDLDGEKPEGFEAGPTENPEDENVAMDPDELALARPGPDPEVVERPPGQFRQGHPLPPRPAHHRRLPSPGPQDRLPAPARAAAIELAILKPGRPLFEVRAPGWRQQAML